MTGEVPTDWVYDYTTNEWFLPPPAADERQAPEPAALPVDSQKTDKPTRLDWLLGPKRAPEKELTWPQWLWHREGRITIVLIGLIICFGLSNLWYWQLKKELEEESTVSYGALYEEGKKRNPWVTGVMVTGWVLMILFCVAVLILMASQGGYIVLLL